MLRSELVIKLAEQYPHLKTGEVENMVDIIFDEISDALENDNRVEIRGFGAFSVRKRGSRQGRNPRSGESVSVRAKAVPFFKAGKELRARLNGGNDPEKR